MDIFKNNKSKKNSQNIRYIILLIIIYLITLLLIYSLFNMQILKGKEYKEMSDARLIKKVNIPANRGLILDRTGDVLANTGLEYSVSIYDIQNDEEKINELSYKLIHILEQNDEKYFSIFPIKTNPFEFRYLDAESLKKWKMNNGIKNEASAKEAFYILKEKYNIKMYEDEDIRKILEMREILKNGKYGHIAGIEVAEKIKRDTAIKLVENQHDLPGVNIISKPVREYLKSNMSSHVIGYVGPISEYDKQNISENEKNRYKNDDIIGKTGIEKTFEKILKGDDGVKQVEMTIEGNITEEYDIKEAKGGSNVVLTIDSKLQKVTENAIRKTISKMKNNGFWQKGLNPRGASAVVMNVKNGEILAMASYPDYEPQKFVGGISQADWDLYRNNTLAPLLNRAIQSHYAPASTFKMTTALAGLETGKIKLDEKIYDKGIYPLAHKPKCWIYSYHGITHGWMDVSTAIKNSCNYFFYEVGNRVGIDALGEYASYLGLGRKTGVEIEGESEGVLASNKAAEERGEEMTLGGLLSAAIGQSYNSFTPIQMAQYISTLTNGGKIVEPTIIKNVIDANGSYLSREEIDEIAKEVTGFKRIKQEDKNINPAHLNKILEGMKSVTSEYGGTAYQTFQNLNVSVGGKTGTAQAGPYQNGIFVGFAPFENPEIAIYAIVENGHEGTFVADIVRDIIAEYFGMNAPIINENMQVVTEREIINY